MNKKLYALYAVMFSLAMLACSDDNVSGSSEDPNVLTAEKNSSSSSLDDVSSSTVSPNFSSSSKNVPILCKASVDWGYDGCVYTPPSGDGDLWSRGLKVKTDAYAEDPSKFGERAGEFFVETDSIEGGETKLLWLGSKRTFESSSLEGDLHAYVTWDKGNLPYEVGHDPYFNLGFYVAGFDSNGVAMSADISNWNGICIVYTGTTNPTLLLDLGDSINQKLGNVLPSVTLFDKREPQCFEWKDFKQPASDKTHGLISGEDAAKHVEKVVFHFQALPRESFGSMGIISILAIGTNRIDPNEPSSSSIQSSSSSENDPCKEKGGKDCVISGRGDLWSLGDASVDTKVYTDGTSKYGHDAGFFFVDDGSDKGAETVFEWFEGTVESHSNRPDHYEFKYGYLSAAVFLEKGGADSTLFFDTGFYVAGHDADGKLLSANIQNWNGICVVTKYMGGGIKLSMQLDLGDSLNSEIGYALPEVALVGDSDSTQCFDWSQFKQPNTDKTNEIISGLEAAKHVSRVIFHFQSSLQEDIFHFDILAIGSNRTE